MEFPNNVLFECFVFWSFVQKGMFVCEMPSTLQAENKNKIITDKLEVGIVCTYVCISVIPNTALCLISCFGYHLCFLCICVLSRCC